MKRFEVDLYEDIHGYCPIANWVRELDQKTNKANKSMLKKSIIRLRDLKLKVLELGSQSSNT